MLNDSGLPAYSYCEFTYAIGYQRMLYVDHANGNDDINDTRFLFVQFWASGERSFPKMGDSLPRTRINRRAKFYAASFIFAGEIHNRTNVQKTNKQWTMYPHIAYRLVWIKSNKKQKHICKRCIRSSYIHFVPQKKSVQLFILWITLSKITHFNFWYVKSWENLTSKAYKFVHITCPLWPLYLGKYQKVIFNITQRMFDGLQCLMRLSTRQRYSNYAT